MRKSLITFALLLAVTALNAQTLIKAKFHKGDKAVYETVADVKTKSSAKGTESVKTTSKTKITVQEATADGYVVEILTNSIKIEGSQAIARQTGNMVSQYLDNVPMIVKTDANGKINDLLNYDEVLSKISRFEIALLDSVYNANPKIEKAMPKIKAITTLKNKLTKESFIESVENSTFFYLFGKTLKNGYKENKDIQDIKATVTYELTKKANALNIVGKISSNMTEDDVKALIIDKMKEVGAEENLELMIAQVETHWDRMKEIGMATMDVNGTTNIQLLNTGWPTEYSSDVNTNRMGVHMTNSSVTKLIEKSWK
ncbi:hypothetical protein [Prevotella fusca]|uniref:Uncharacterized protein n=1 Tax=Prevotella fusca JCM 17724 TaxID=1236517 RepID=A0A0K1NMX6_9BACT|nr:hypothetical protein [Prevotella fusca]AKU70400.1 hypothetical protein ADJ77_11595 [Prevotella fusca JCM 17724]QUB86033.1 hypothetical protein J5A51_01845 [Prevotella fusca JCM 17724]